MFSRDWLSQLDWHLIEIFSRIFFIAASVGLIFLLLM